MRDFFSCLHCMFCVVYLYRYTRDAFAFGGKRFAAGIAIAFLSRSLSLALAEELFFSRAQQWMAFAMDFLSTGTVSGESECIGVQTAT